MKDGLRGKWMDNNQPASCTNTTDYIDPNGTHMDHKPVTGGVLCFNIHSMNTVDKTYLWVCAVHREEGTDSVVKVVQLTLHHGGVGVHNVGLVLVELLVAATSPSTSSTAPMATRWNNHVKQSNQLTTDTICQGSIHDAGLILVELLVAVMPPPSTICLDHLGTIWTLSKTSSTFTHAPHSVWCALCEAQITIADTFGLCDEDNEYGDNDGDDNDNNDDHTKRSNVDCQVRWLQHTSTYANNYMRMTANKALLSCAKGAAQPLIWQRGNHWVFGLFLCLFVYFWFIYWLMPLTDERDPFSDEDIKVWVLISTWAIFFSTSTSVSCKYLVAEKNHECPFWWWFRRLS